jgi:photosystem II stability/assembly factor-like uncharacterized protein
VLVAADSVKVFIDSDDSALTGCPFPGMGFGADNVLVVTGIGGRILSREAYSWSCTQNDWLHIGTFEAAKDSIRIELQVPLSLLKLTASATVKVLVYASDWVGQKDILDNAIVLRDPLVLADNSSVYHSSDGQSWSYKTHISNDDAFCDICSGPNGYIYALAKDGRVFKSTGDWSSWTKIIDPQNMDYFVALAINNTTFYALQNDGNVYKTTSGVNWSRQGNLSASYDWEDMCAAPNGTLYAIRTVYDDTVYKSTDGGKNWSAFGTKNVGNNGDIETNVGIVCGPGWNNATYVMVLQSEGELRYDTDGTAASPWNVLSAPSCSSSYEFVDIALGPANGTLWTLTLQGKVYSFKFNTTAPCGTWDISLGDSSGGSGVAIAAPLNTPEFRDAVLPLAGMMAVFMYFRARRRRTCQPALPAVLPD